MWQDLYIHSISAGNPFYQAWKLFSADIWKMLECHFWANVMLRQSRLRTSRASPAQKSQGLRVVCSKNFSRATFFVFWSTQMVDIYLSYLPMKKIWWKSAVWIWETETKRNEVSENSLVTLLQVCRMDISFGESFMKLTLFLYRYSKKWCKCHIITENQKS